MKDKFLILTTLEHKALNAPRECTVFDLCHEGEKCRDLSGYLVPGLVTPGRFYTMITLFTYIDKN